MNSEDGAFIMNILQAHTVALCALLATHPDPKTLAEAFETMANRTDADPETLELLRRAIS